MIYHITCSTDDNYLQHCVVMLCSVFENNQNMRFMVHLLHSELSKESQEILSKLCSRYKNEISFYKIDNNILNNVCRREVSHVTIATYYRVLLPSLIDKSIDRIFYLDCDIVVMNNIEYLYKMNLEGYALAAVKDASPEDATHREIMGLEMDGRSFCAGVVMINLKYWREHDSQKALLDFACIKRPKYYMDDQDAMNYVFHNRWFMLPPTWGKTPLTIGFVSSEMRSFDQFDYAFNPKIIHYAGKLKPWFDVWFPDKEYYLHYLKVSEYTSPKFIHISFTYRLRIWKANLRYFINRYIRAFIPDFLEIIIRDIANFISFFISCTSADKIKRWFINRWIQKYFY